jgi:hypothetical protein
VGDADKRKMPAEGIPDVPSFFLNEDQEQGGYESEDKGKIEGCKYADLIPEQPGNQGGGEGAKTDGHLKYTQACGPITLRRELRDERRLDCVQNAFV